MKPIQWRTLKTQVYRRQFSQIFRPIALLTTALLVVIYGIGTVQRLSSLREKMIAGADLLALKAQEKLNYLQSASIYMASLDSVKMLLVQEKPSMSTLSRCDDILTSFSGSDISVEFLSHKSGTVIASDYGLTDYAHYLDGDFLSGLMDNLKVRERWVLRDYRQNIYVEPKPVLSYIRALPLTSVQNKGYIVVNLTLSSLTKAISSAAEPDLGEYAVWLRDDLPLAASGSERAQGTAHVCCSAVETAAKAAYWMPFGAMLTRSAPNPLLALGVYVVCMLLCALVALLICRQRMAKLNVLVDNMSGEYPLEEGYEDQEDQLCRIFENLTTELTHARQFTAEGLPLLQERLIGELLRTHVSVAERRESLDRCGIGLNKPYFAVVQVVLETQDFDEQLYLLVRHNVLSQLAELGEVYSTYGDGSSILFLLNTQEYVTLEKKLENQCETMHDALKQFLSVRIIFSIGICTAHNPTPHDAYYAACEHLSTLRKMDMQAQQAVVMSYSPGYGASLQGEDVQHICDAIQAQDARTLEEALIGMLARSFPENISLADARKRALVFLMRTSAFLTAVDFLPSLNQLSATLCQQFDSIADVRDAIRAWCLSQLRTGSDQAEDSNQYVGEALRFIHENYMHGLNVPEIGEAVNVNSIYLNRLFKTATGNTLSNYLNQYRCERARAMLEKTQDTVGEISDACGFSEVRSFIRYFKKYYLETPTEYRKRIRE